jgi:MFS family permease
VLPAPVASAPFRQLWAARTLSSFGDGVTVAALLIYATTVEPSGAKLGLLLVAEIAPTFLSPLAGALSDRFDRRRVLVGAELAQGLVMTALAARMPSFPVLVALVFLRALAATVLRPAVTSAIPVFVEDERLPAANAWLRGGEEGASLAGPLLAGVLAPLLGLRAMFAIDAATFLLGALLLLRLPRFQVTREPGDAGLLGGSGAGVRYVARHPLPRAIALSLFMFVFFAAIENVPRPFLAQRDLGAGALGVGVLIAAAQLGMILGLFAIGAIGRRAERAHLAPLLVVGMAVYGLGAIATSVAPGLVLAAAGQLLSGIGNGVEVGCVDTLLQRAVPKPFQGRVIANVYGAASLAAGLAYAAGGALLDRSSARPVFAIVGAGCLFSALVTALLLGSALRRGVDP